MLARGGFTISMKSLGKTGVSKLRVLFRLYGLLDPQFYYIIVRRSGTETAANGVAVLPIVVVGRIDAGGAVEVEVVGVAAVGVWRR
jgi:hypothetical protein